MRAGGMGLHHHHPYIGYGVAGRQTLPERSRWIYPGVGLQGGPGHSQAVTSRCTTNCASSTSQRVGQDLERLHLVGTEKPSNLVSTKVQERTDGHHRMPGLNPDRGKVKPGMQGSTVHDADIGPGRPDDPNRWWHGKENPCGDNTCCPHRMHPLMHETDVGNGLCPSARAIASKRVWA